MLGRFQDTEVQRRALRSFAEEMMADGTAAEAVLAMGELIGHLDAEQDRARAEFDSRLRDVRPAGRRSSASCTSEVTGEGHRDATTSRAASGRRRPRSTSPTSRPGRASRTLLWDLDPQAAATFLFRVRPRVKGGGRGLVTRRARSRTP